MLQDHKSRPISVYCHSAQLWRLLFTPRSFESGTSPNLMGTVAKATFLCPPHLKGSTLFMLDLGAPNDPYIWYENSHLFPKSTQEVLYIGCGRKDIPSMWIILQCIFIQYKLFDLHVERPHCQHHVQQNKLPGISRINAK